MFRRSFSILKYRNGEFQVAIRSEFFWGLIKLPWLTPRYDNCYDHHSTTTNFELNGSRCRRDNYTKALGDYTNVVARYGKHGGKISNVIDIIRPEKENLQKRLEDYLEGDESSEEIRILTQFIKNS